MTVLRWAWLAAVLTLGIAQGAEAQWSSFYGGWGGSTFTDTCGAGKQVRNIRIRAASYVDGMQVACNPGDNNANNNWLGWHGGFGGDYSELYCGKYVAGITAFYGTYVNALSFFCYSHLRGGTRATYTKTVGARVGDFSSFSCPTGRAIVAYMGSAGTFLDRVSFYCEARGPD